MSDYLMVKEEVNTKDMQKANKMLRAEMNRVKKKIVIPSIALLKYTKNNMSITNILLYIYRINKLFEISNSEKNNVNSKGMGKSKKKKKRNKKKSKLQGGSIIKSLLEDEPRKNAAEEYLETEEEEGAITALFANLSVGNIWEFCFGGSEEAKLQKFFFYILSILILITSHITHVSQLPGVPETSPEFANLTKMTGIFIGIISIISLPFNGGFPLTLKETLFIGNAGLLSGFTGVKPLTGPVKSAVEFWSGNNAAAMLN